MEMLEFLESDKEQVMNGLVKAGEPEAAQAVLEKELDRLLLKYNEECAEERMRESARHMLQTAKMMIPLISAAGETRIWSKNSSAGGSQGVKLSKTAIACIAGGILFLVGALVGLALSAGKEISVIYDKDGSHYGKGKGYLVFVDGKKAFQADSYAVKTVI